MTTPAINTGSARLRAYLNENELKTAEFARRIKKTRGYVTDLLQKRARPSIDTALDIQVATSGEVKVQSWATRPPIPLKKKLKRPISPIRRKSPLKRKRRAG